MCSELLYPFVKYALGTLYPAYKTWKALKRKDETTRRRWMKYWISFAAFQTVEPLADVTIIFITPFYYLIKIILITWLVYGTKIVYDSIIDRELRKREKAIDKCLTRAYKLRNDIIAVIWFELSRCSVRIITALMSGGLSVLVKSHPEHSETIFCETSPNSDNTNSIVDPDSMDYSSIHTITQPQQLDYI